MKFKIFINLLHEIKLNLIRDRTHSNPSSFFGIAILNLILHRHTKIDSSILEDNYHIYQNLSGLILYRFTLNSINLLNMAFPLLEQSNKDRSESNNCLGSNQFSD